MEKLIADALDAANVRYVTDFAGRNPTGLDFYLPGTDVHIEVKQFHSPRIAEQMSRAPNVIAVQGEKAVRFMAYLIGLGAIDGDEHR